MRIWEAASECQLFIVKANTLSLSQRMHSVASKSILLF